MGPGNLIWTCLSVLSSTFVNVNVVVVQFLAKLRFFFFSSTMYARSPSFFSNYYKYWQWESPLFGQQLFNFLSDITPQTVSIFKAKLSRLPIHLEGRFTWDVVTMILGAGKKHQSELNFEIRRLPERESNVRTRRGKVAWAPALECCAITLSRFLKWLCHFWSWFPTALLCFA